MFGVTPKYAFNAPVVPAVDESVTVVPSTTDATVVPNGMPGPCTGCPTNIPTLLGTRTVALPLVIDTICEAAAGAAKDADVAVPVPEADNVATPVAESYAVTNVFAAIVAPGSVTICPTLIPIVARSAAANVNVFPDNVGATVVACTATGANNNVAGPVAVAAADNVTVVPLTLTTRVPPAKVPVDPGPAVTGIPG
jgi:hypothetical protein